MEDYFYIYDPLHPSERHSIYSTVGNRLLQQFLEAEAGANSQRGGDPATTPSDTKQVIIPGLKSGVITPENLSEYLQYDSKDNAINYISRQIVQFDQPIARDMKVPIRYNKEDQTQNIPFCYNMQNKIIHYQMC